MLLAADVGGTKTLLGLFKEAPERPDTIEVGEFVTLDYDSLVPMIREFLKAEGVEPRAITAASFGVAGAVTDQVARLTNVPWLVDGALISCAALAIDGDGLHRLFPTLVLLGALHASRPDRWPNLAALLGDRAVLALALALGTAFDVAEPAVMLAALAILALDAAVFRARLRITPA